MQGTDAFRIRQTSIQSQFFLPVIVLKIVRMLLVHLTRSGYKCKYVLKIWDTLSCHMYDRRCKCVIHEEPEEEEQRDICYFMCRKSGTLCQCACLLRLESK